MVEPALPYFLARPAGAGPYPGIVLLHEGNGITPQLLRFAQRLCAQGYAVVAPDLYFRVGGTESAGFAALMQSLAPGQALADIEAAAAALRDLGCPRVGVAGFCMGGSLTWDAAVSGSGFAAAVGFYGSEIARVLGAPACPTLLLFGGSDPYIPAADIAVVAAHHAETIVYPDAGHGFMRDGSDSYDPAAAADAWARTLAFFGEHLR